MKPKNGRTTNQDYVNLLYSESDSDPPDLKLPPLNKSKKQRKKRGLSFKSTSEDSNNSTWSVWTFMKLVIVMFLLAAVAVLGVLSFWLLRQVAELKDQVESVESQSKQDDNDVVKLQTDFLTFNKSLVNMHSENLKLQRNLTLLDGKYKTIIVTSSALQTSLKSIKDLNKLTQIDTLARSLATFGSSLEDFKSDIKSQIEDVKKRISGLENANSPGIEKKSDTATTTPPIPGVVHVVEQLNILNHDIDQLNATFLQKINTLSKNLTSRVEVLENSTRKLTKDIDQLNSHTMTGEHAGTPPVPGTMKPQITSVIQDMIKNKEINMLDNGETVSALQLQVANLTSLVDEIQLNHTQMESDHSILNFNHTKLIEELQNQTTISVQSVNSSVLKLTGEVDDLFTKLTGNTNKLHHVSETVEGLKQYIAYKENTSSSAPVSPLPTSSPSVDTSTNTSPFSTVSATPSPIVIPSIKNYKDLKNKYGIVSKTGQDGIKLSDFQDVMPSKDIPTEESMKPYDKDNNGLYNLKELSTALGFPDPDVPADLE